MGMFDTIWLPDEPQFRCPRGHRIQETQTKDLQFDLDEYDFRDGALHPRERERWGKPHRPPDLNGEQVVSVHTDCDECDAAGVPIADNWFVWFLLMDGMKVREVVKDRTHPLVALFRG